MLFRSLPGARHEGAVLRVAGRTERSQGLQETGDWTEIRVEFPVDRTSGEVSLLCEFRASHGRARFDRASLLLERME